MSVTLVKYEPNKEGGLYACNLAVFVNQDREPTGLPVSANFGLGKIAIERTDTDTKSICSSGLRGVPRRSEDLYPGARQPCVTAGNCDG